MPVVLDASALVELLLQSDRAPAVLQAIGNTELAAPDVINLEALSTLRRLEWIEALPSGRAGQAVDDLRVAQVRRFPTLPLLPAAWTLRANVTSYDACYVALAEALGCTLVTADLKLSRVPGLGVPLITV
jgi:predicted nucleic acid-binding protein